MVFRRYSTTQLRYAMTYVLVTVVALFILNIYCSKTCHALFYQSKENSMIEKCLLASDEIAKLEVLNESTVTTAVSQMSSLKVSRLLVTDKSGTALYDSLSEAIGDHILLPETVQASRGYDVFSWQYHDGLMRSQAATPIMRYGTVVGCVYMMESDFSLGFLILSLQKTILQITFVVVLAVLLFSFLYAFSFSRRLNRIMSSMRIIQEGDYTHKVKIGGNDELTMLGNEFNDLTERLHTSEQKRARFVSDASHELKTPLASIKLLSDSILQNDMDSDTVREFVSDIGAEAERLNRMTAKLLSLTKLDGEAAPDCEIIYMAPTVHRVVRMLSAIAQANDISFRLSLDGDCPILIQEDDLYQIIFNLMENGIKYNTPGGTLTVSLLHEDDNAILQISDTGVGIPEDALAHIFERFYRVDKARSRATGGSGLGLSIVRAIVNRNRGEIEVQSQHGKGTTFRVTFPAFETEVDKE